MLAMLMLVVALANPHAAPSMRPFGANDATAFIQLTEPSLTPPPASAPANSTAARVVKFANSCAAQLGVAPGQWLSIIDDSTPTRSRLTWRSTPRPPCAAMDFIGDTQSASSVVAGRRFFFLGDSVARDMLIALQRAVVPRDGYGNPIMALQSREEAKQDCHKYIAREHPCAFELGSASRAYFHWFQWWSLSSHLHGLPVDQGQETDLCCSEAAAGADGSMIRCLRGFTSNATSSDVLLLHAGLDYMLFEEKFSDWEATLEADFRAFLPLIPSVFPGTVVFYLMAPTLAQGQIPGKCDNTGGYWDVKMWQIARKSARVNAIIAPLIRDAGFAAIDPWVYTSGTMASHYIDCVHPGAVLQEAAANLLLNIIAKGGISATV